MSETGRDVRAAPSAGWWSAAVVAAVLVSAYAGGRAYHDSFTWLAAYFAATMAIGNGRRPLGLAATAADAHGPAHVLVARALAGG